MRYFEFTIVLLMSFKLQGQTTKPDFEKHFNGSLHVGAWIPTEELEIVGVHPFYGGVLGLQITRTTSIDFYTDVRLLNSPKQYDYVYRGVKETDNFYRGLAFGLQLEQRLFRMGDHGLGIMLGFGYDKLDFKSKRGFYRRMFSPDGFADTESYVIGVVFNQELNSDLKLGYFVNYTFINYAQSGKFDYNGDALNVGIRIKAKGTDLK